MKLGLKGKVVLLVSCLVIAVITINAAIMLQTERKERERQLLERGKLFARLTVTDVVREYGTNSWGTSSGSAAKMKRFFEYYPDLTRLMVVSQNGMLLYDSDATPGAPAGKDRIDDPMLMARLAKADMDAQIIKDGSGERFIDILAPVTESGGPQFIKVRYIISYRSMEEKLSAIRREFMQLAGIFIIIGVAAAVFFSIRLTGPLRQLTYGAGEIARGNLDYTVSEGAKDEIGELARSFNQMACAIREHRRELETANTSLTRANQEMVALQAELVRSERMAAVGELAAGLSHEIDNPVGVILGFAELLLEETPEGDPRREDLKMILSESKRCKRIVRGLLDFSRPPALGVVPTGIDEVVGRTIEAASSQRLFKRVRFIHTPSETPTVMADPDRLRQVFMNLFINSAQAMPEGGEITITSGVDETAGMIAVTITDAGPGISADNIDRVFEPFFTTKRPGEGTGLGLAICRRLLQEHGGDISARPAATGGAEFTVNIPLRREMVCEMDDGESKKLERSGDI